MTVKELRLELQRYPDNMVVRYNLESYDTGHSYPTIKSVYSLDPIPGFFDKSSVILDEDES